MKHIVKSIVVVSVIIFVAGFISVNAQTSSDTQVSTSAGTGTQRITFPIPELGNCASKDACRVYCNDTANIDVCVSFAKAHGLMNKDDGDRAGKFRDAI